MEKLESDLSKNESENESQSENESERLTHELLSFRCGRINFGVVVRSYHHVFLCCRITVPYNIDELFFTWKIFVLEIVFRILTS